MYLSSELHISWLPHPRGIMQCACVQAAQQGDSAKVDKRRKKKQKEQAEDEAFLDNGQDEDAEYQQGGSGKPLPSRRPCTPSAYKRKSETAVSACCQLTAARLRLFTLG